MSGWDFDPVPDLGKTLLGFYGGHRGEHHYSRRMLENITNFGNGEAAFLTSHCELRVQKCVENTPSPLRKLFILKNVHTHTVILRRDKSFSKTNKYGVRHLSFVFWV